MNISKFVVLGTLDRIGPASGYDVIRELDKKMISRWTSVKKGSVYHALKTLNNDGLIQETERLKQGMYPTSTLYKITAAGRTEFDRMQAEAFLGLYPCYFGFKLALKFNVRRSAAELEAFAAKAIKVIDNTVAGMDAYLDSLDASDPRLASDPLFIEHDKMLLRQEKQWIQMAVEVTVNGQK
jgi:DNA-binding PadR family transcriptional regulator